MDRRVFDQGLGPHVPDSRAWGTMHGMSLGRVWSVMSSGPHVIQQMTTFRYRIIILYQGGQGCLGFGSGGSVHKTPSKWVNLLTQPLSNRFHNNLAYLNLHVCHLESSMNIMEDSQRKW